MMLLYGLFDPGKRGKLAGMFKLGSKVIIKLGWCVVLLRVADLGRYGKPLVKALKNVAVALAPAYPQSCPVRAWYAG